MMADYMKRDKWFFVSPQLGLEWPYKSRLALGVNLDDFKALYKPILRFKVKDILYEIETSRAIELGNMFKLPFNSNLRNLLPYDEFKKGGENATTNRDLYQS